MSNKVYAVVYLDYEDFEILKIFYSKSRAEEFRLEEIQRREDKDKTRRPWMGAYHSWGIVVEEYEIND